jgi:hypothetical protein
MQLLSGVPKNVTMFALAWVPRLAFRSGTCVPLASLSVSLGLSALALSPQRGLGQEVSWWRWCHCCHGRLHGRPLSIGSGLNQARSRVRLTPAGALC